MCKPCILGLISGERSRAHHRQRLAAEFASKRWPEDDHPVWWGDRPSVRVYDVASSDARVPGADGKLPAVGNTVDTAATWRNSIGATELSAVWRDPDFDSMQRALYYARVIEIPTPRWTAYDANRFGVKVPEAAPLTVQERAYTSPVWFTPAK